MPPLDVLLPVLGLALLDTLSPSTLGVSLFVLLSGVRRPARPLLTYLGTVVLFYFVLGCALMFGLGTILSSLSHLVDSPAVGWGMILLGGALFVYSWVMPTKKRAPRRPASLRTTTMIGLGLATGLLEAGTALPYLGAIGVMGTAGLAVTTWMPMLAAYNLIMVLPPVLLYLGHRIFGERLRPRLERWREKVDSGSREALAWIIGIVGLVLVLNGLQQVGIDTLLSTS